MATYHFGWWKVSREQPSMLLIAAKKYICFPEKFTYQVLPKKNHPRHPDINTYSKWSFQLNCLFFAGIESTVEEKKGYSKCSNITPLLNQGTLQMAPVTPQGQFFIAMDTAQAECINYWVPAQENLCSPCWPGREEFSGTVLTGRSTELLTAGIKMKELHGVTLCIVSV